MRLRALRPIIVITASLVILVAAQGALGQTSRSSDGAAMYRSYCAACHGPKGGGNGPVASTLKSKPTDLSRLAKNNGGQFPRERMMMILSYGADVRSHGTVDMPLWGSMFRTVGGEQDAQQRIAALSSYIETLQVK
jgi:mono/diheme cytochrome c family protein